MKIGIIGLGDGGRCNLHSLEAIGAEVVAICDTNVDVLHAVDKEKGGRIRAYSDMSGLLACGDIDLVVVATPDGDHLGPVEAALRAGRRVFIEKPAATTPADLERLEALHRAYPGYLLFSEKYTFACPIQAALARRADLGAFMGGATSYTMSTCGRIMGGGKWRTESAYNPCAGGLSHNFMTAVLLAGSPIAEVSAVGHVLTYRELKVRDGFDTMRGMIRFASGQTLGWSVCLAVQGADSPFGHRTVTHTLQFEHGSLAYGPVPESDRLIVAGQPVPMTAEPGAAEWSDYNLGVLYGGMHRDIMKAITTGSPTLHSLAQGINVAYACYYAFDSAQYGGVWVEVPHS